MKWTYIIPRLIILGLIVLILWISADPLLKKSIVGQTQSVVGAKVEIGQVKSSLFSGKVYLKDFAISDPRNPMQNLIQADLAYLQLDPRKLLHRELIIEHGHSKRVLFGAPRTESGALPNHEYLNDELTKWIPAKIKDQSFAKAKDWLDKIESPTILSNNRNLETLKVSAAIHKSWPDRFLAHARNIKSIQDNIDSLKSTLENRGTNLLREDLSTQEINLKLKAFNEQLVQAREQLANLTAEADNDRIRLARALDKDKLGISTEAKIRPMDGETMSHLLLGEQQADYLTEILAWVHWFQNSIPNPETDFQPTSARGTDIVFQGEKKRPSFLIKTLDLSGEGTLAGQHIEFAGVAQNLTTQPQKHDQPTTFELRAQGEHHMMVKCTLDRRHELTQDSLEVKCPEFQIPNQLLGDGNSLIVEMGNSKLHANVNIVIKGDEISGTLEFVHTDCGFQIDQLHDLAGGKEMALRMNQEIGTINKYTTHATLGGTLQQPTIDFHSDLGNRFANVMNQIAIAKNNEQVQARKKQIDEMYAAEVKKFDDMLRTNFVELTRQIDGKKAVVAELEEIVPRLESWPNIRR